MKWEPYDPTIKGEDVPMYCDAGPFSHVWSFEISYDGHSLWTDECDACNAAAQSQYNDMGDYIVGEFTVKLTPEVHEYSHPEGREVDYMIRMTPQ